jgi:hypothetical protein
MPQRRRSPIAALVVVTTMGLAVPLAFGDDDASNVAAARKLAKEGVLLAEDGKCKEAIEKLSKAEALHHAPTILEWLGECQVKIGKLVDGTENLQRVVREPLGTNPPPAFLVAIERAKKVLADATPKIAKLTIDVTSPSGVSAVVRIDGELVPAALYGLERPTDPGHHDLEARADGWVTAKASVDLAEGASSKVALAISEKSPDAVATETSASAMPSASVAAPPPYHPPPEPYTAPREKTASPSKLPAFVALGMGAAGLVVGTTFGLVAMHHKSNLDGACDANKKCPTSEQSDLDSARRDANVSTVGFGVAIVGGLVGGALLLFGPSSTPSDTTHGYVAPTIGLGTLGVQGAF